MKGLTTWGALFLRRGHGISFYPSNNPTRLVVIIIRKLVLRVLNNGPGPHGFTLCDGGREVRETGVMTLSP